MRILLAFIAICSLASGALACDCIRFVPGGPHADSDIRAIASEAAVILDARLVRPLGPLLEPAIVRPIRVLKGPKRKAYKVGVISDCALLLRAPDVKPGQTLRLILYGTPELYEASRCANLQSAAFDAAVEQACRASKAN